ncbi:hypothetical protein M9H77_17766 [Catharanthus roseus]|uniref:Uncharacterized protein n=1 Tax=Catharanthus roseus TaxID=4058 RepID=A0ACC0B5V8_CATRO|nr:hypothetical protein M9H77_17766 [Catharanthus roseus]
MTWAVLFTLRVDLFKEGHSTVEGLAQLVFTRTLHHALGWVGHLVESQRRFIFDDLVMGSRLCPWNLTVAVHVLLNLGIVAILMCLDSLRLLSYARTPHVVPRGTQIPYSVAVNPVAGLEVSQVVLEL